jgi:hypothetical protein
MKIDIYRSTTDGNKYLSVPADTDMNEFLFPADLDSDLKNLMQFKESIEVDPDRRSVGLDALDITKQIEKNGYAVHGITISFDVDLRG